MKRRDFIAGLGSAAAWPVVARAQQGARMRRIGVLMNGTVTALISQAYLAAFIDGLRQLGWNEGQNLRLDIRWNEADAGLSHTNAAQVIESMPDAILAMSTINLTMVRQATTSVPVVFVAVSDPVVQGFVASIREPGGNVTGFSQYEFATGGKWVELLKQAAPSLERAAVMFNPEEAPQFKYFMRAIEAAALSVNIQAIATPIRTADDIEPALASFARSPNGGLIVPNGAFTSLHSSLIVDLAGRLHLPLIAAQSVFVERGGLMTYGVNVNVVEQFRQAASYVDRILKGSKPGQLPVQAPTSYRLVINLKTAKALGLTIPETLLATADEVIQ